jgi:pimeloyl-ACP methyl ester carboxylesterase
MSSTLRYRLRRVLGTVFITALALFALALLAAAAWAAFTTYGRSTREVHSADQLAAGRGRWVGTDSAEIYLQEWGEPSAPVLLLVHGTGAWSGTWFGLPDGLTAAGWRVVAIDLPPFGLSKLVGAKSRIDYSRSAQAARISAVVANLGVPVTLVGHSFGAGPALEAALHANGTVRQLVLVDPALGLGAAGDAPHCDSAAGGSVWLANRTVRTALVGATATWPGASGTLLRSFVHRKNVVDEALIPAYQLPFGREFFTSTLGDWATAFSKGNCESADSLNASRLTQWAATGATPLALIWGAEDTITPIAQGHALQRWMPSASLSVIPGVGHIPHIEDPAAFAAALKSALRPAR